VLFFFVFFLVCVCVCEPGWFAGTQPLYAITSPTLSGKWL